MPLQNDGLLSRIFNGVCNKVYELIKRCHEVNETDDYLHVRLYVPGLLKEDVEICVDHNTLTLTIKDTEGHKLYAIYDLPGKPYKIHHTKAHMDDDGELHIYVPKINQKEEKNQERNQQDVKINVNIE